MTTSTSAVIIPPASKPAQNARNGEPRRTGELSTRAELRLQVEPLVAKPAAAPMASHRVGGSPAITAVPAASTSTVATVRGCQVSRTGKRDTGQPERQMVKNVWP